MFEDTTPLPTVFDPLELELAAAACCGRFGDPLSEAERLVTLRDLIAGSSSLAHQLESFARAAAAHLRGVHCTANMQPEAASLARAVVAWADRLQAAANAHRDWQEQQSLMEAGPIQRTRGSLSSLSAIGPASQSRSVAPIGPAA